MTAVEVSGGGSTATTQTDRTWTIVVPSNGDWITSNNRSGHPQAQGRRVKAWRETAYQAACAVRPKLPTGLMLVRLDIAFRWAKPPVDTVMNMAETIKAVVDGAIGPKRGSAVGYGLVIDDSFRHVQYGSLSIETAAFPRGRVTLDPVPARSS